MDVFDINSYHLNTLLSICLNYTDDFHIKGSYSLSCCSSISKSQVSMLGYKQS